MKLCWLDQGCPPDSFPPLESALSEPDGLLAAGADLTPERMLYAYRHGIFPWYDDGQPVLWWSPDPRTVIEPDKLHVSRSLARRLRRCGWTWTVSRRFSDVVEACAEPRKGQAGTWITNDMKAAYQLLHKADFARSIEIWEHDELIGGIYGLCIDRVFFGESMFSRATDASKAAIVALCHEMHATGMPLLDCQVHSSHLATLGAKSMARSEFSALLRQICALERPSPAFSADKREVLQLLD